MNSRSRILNAAIAFVVALVAHSSVFSQQSTAPLGAASVHLRYYDKDVRSFYSEVTVKRSAPGTYFAVTGWHNGYFGLQELYDGKKVLIFSVWDSDNDDATATPQKDRIAVVHKDLAVRVGRFGSEGSGGQAFLDYNWNINSTYAFMVKARRVDNRAEYAAYFLAPEVKQWRHLITFSTPHAATYLDGLYSFAEDFQRSELSSKNLRRAIFSNGWVRTQDGRLKRLLMADFTSSPDNVRSVDAEASSLGFTLATGGLTDNVTRPLGSRLTRSASINDDGPSGL